ncbi:M14-type cytosolic carboxypeptidase [Aestuariirhabdus sp. Z084]|uniref:M14 family metallopeptidase n=1 Tax=Aestuariirhabdus haliotis TaxID=2918751 RepID=UPI00201B3941|nr:M14-type cytosolic carboxypeptidase [Aestuariirhabdus haliotis]MCL6415527.1 M14-type cytosolic carboxypeptidase [Aestuariirhabdus haliotis]MCL6419268.1 M14-type cytosolic carboxypeptidase [Aestuariirhabdus haliotis]
MQINAAFDGGNIEVVSAERADDIQLNIRTDHNSDFYQWFYFRLSGVRGQACHMKILNAAGAAYPGGWENYAAVASYDRKSWFRVPTTYRDGVLGIKHEPVHNAVYYAYFAPYSMEQHADFIASLQTHSRVQLKVLGETLDGQPLDQLVIGEPGAGKKKLWIQARQHPGETMASWWMEGFVPRLLDSNDAIARALLDKAVFYVVPNMNPDGSRRGHLRTNAAGANLNREWLTPTAEHSPEVLLVREQMAQIGVDFCLDVHGDEALPYNFIAGTHGIPSWNEQRLNAHNGFGQALRRANPDFQMVHGYPDNQPGNANMNMCTNYVAETFDCVAITLEMPFKDTADTPQPKEGWSPVRCKRLGASALDALHDIIDQL